jgi:hypothetical protein
MTAVYSDAMKEAQRELADCDAAIEKLERKQAKLRQTVAVLQSLMGIEVPHEQSLTEAILMTVKASVGYVTTVQVLKMLAEMNYKVQPASVATILSRLVKNGQIASAASPQGFNGYAWKTATTKPERLAALRTLITKR